METTKKLGQEPAFSAVAFGEGQSFYEVGMSKRFYAACMAMQGLIAHYGVQYENGHAKKAFQFADNLLEQENE